jgi:hypothetical protein
VTTSTLSVVRRRYVVNPWIEDEIVQENVITQISSRLWIYDERLFSEAIFTKYGTYEDNDEAFRVAEAMFKLRKSAGLAGVVVAYLPKIRSHEDQPSVWVPKKEGKGKAKKRT